MLVSVSEETVCIEYNNSSRLAVVLTNNYFFCRTEEQSMVTIWKFLQVTF